MDTLTKVKTLIAEHLNKNINDINENTNIVEDLGADSLDIVEMLMGLEDEFGITIDDNEASKFKTVGDVVKLIENSK